MENLNKLRNEYTQMPMHCLERIANDDYAIDKKVIKSSNTKTLVDLMIAVEFKNFYK